MRAVDNKAIFKAPTTAGMHQCQSAATSGVAQSISIWGGYSAADKPKGKCWLHIEAVTTNCYLRTSTTATTATTANNGMLIQTAPQGHENILVDPNVDLFFDVLSTGVGVIKWWVSSEIAERRDI